MSFRSPVRAPEIDFAPGHETETVVHLSDSSVPSAKKRSIFGFRNRDNSSYNHIDNMPSSTGNVLLYFLAIFLPPVAVLLKSGCGADFLINILLTILAWLPGVIHAWYVISKKEKEQQQRVEVVQPTTV